jgi:hypothetical protein
MLESDPESSCRMGSEQEAAKKLDTLRKNLLTRANLTLPFEHSVSYLLRNVLMMQNSAIGGWPFRVNKAQVKLLYYNPLGAVSSLMRSKKNSKYLKA